MILESSMKTLAFPLTLVAALTFFAHNPVAAANVSALATVDGEGARSLAQQARSQIEQGKYKAAVRSLGIAIRKDPTAAEAYFLRSVAYDHLGLPNHALRDLNQFIKLRPSDARGYIRRGDIKNFNMQHEEAIVDYETAARLAPSSSSPFLGRGLARVALGRHDEAIKDYLWVLKLDPDNREVLGNIGIACMLAGKPFQAMTYFEKALSVETNPRWRKQIREWMSRLLNEVEASGSKKAGPTRLGSQRPRPMW